MSNDAIRELALFGNRMRLGIPSGSLELGYNIESARIRLGRIADAAGFDVEAASRECRPIFEHTSARLNPQERPSRSAD